MAAIAGFVAPFEERMCRDLRGPLSAHGILVTAHAGSARRHSFTMWLMTIEALLVDRTIRGRAGTVIEVHLLVAVGADARSESFLAVGFVAIQARFILMDFDRRILML